MKRVIRSFAVVMAVFVFLVLALPNDSWSSGRHHFRGGHSHFSIGLGFTPFAFGGWGYPYYSGYAYPSYGYSYGYPSYGYGYSYPYSGTTWYPYSGYYYYPQYYYGPLY